MSKVNVFIGQGSRDMAHNLDDLLERWQLAHYPEDSKITTKDIRLMDASNFSAYIRDAQIEHLRELYKELGIVQSNMKAYASAHFLADTTKNPEKNLNFKERGKYFALVRAKRKCGSYMNAIHHEMSLRPKVIKTKTVVSIFLDIVWDEEVIPREQFRELMKRAKSIYANQEKKQL